LLTLAQSGLAQDGPVLPGLEPGEAAPEPVQRDQTLPSSPDEPLPVDDSITPLDENGRPMSEPEIGNARLPAAPPLPVLPHAPASVHTPQDVPAFPSKEQTPMGGTAGDQLEQEPQKRNLWQRSTDALRDLTPKMKKDSAAQQDAARQRQLLRQRELEQQQRQTRQRKPTLPQQGWDPRARMQKPQPRPSEGNIPGGDARTRPPAATPQASIRRQSPGSAYPRSNTSSRNPAVRPSTRMRKPSQPREAMIEPRSPWERR
jgi:hypothetical protein